MTTISIFNNKGGVGKTTYMYHVAHLISRRNKSVLIVDCDSQCNLTAYAMEDSDIRRAWSETGNSIFKNIEPVYKTTGDVSRRQPSRVAHAEGDLFIVPGDLRLSDFEDRLGDTWNGAKGGSEPSLRAQSAIHRYIEWAKDRVKADLVLIDLGPNLGALNRAVLASSGYFITPVAPDLFSIQGTANLGSKLLTWRQEWDQCHAAYKGEHLNLPGGKPVYLGYVKQMHNVRANPEGMTEGWKIYGNDVEPAVQENIVEPLQPLGQVYEWADDSFDLGQVPNLHSLVPYSQAAKKPVFDCTSADGLKGAHIKRALESASHFSSIVETIELILNE